LVAPPGAFGVGFSALLLCEWNKSNKECDCAGLLVSDLVSELVSGVLFFIPKRDRALSIIDGFGGGGAGVAGGFATVAGAAAGRFVWFVGVVAGV
jgi:hypothetical protein